ncbi:hypothetical protein QQX98_003560 [Neonectria punicea]|uniref:Nucleoside phosphorylase domain-containing protein n=1 Tax=Neonectria punicea TaxID=979145 RepID=A0ABR1HE46_9HYPO
MPLRKRGWRSQLFRADYCHQHQASSQSPSETCNGDLDRVCEECRHLSCQELDCDKRKIIKRERLIDKRNLEARGQIKEAQAPYVFVGRFGSADTVLKSGEEHDIIAKRYGLMAFEMEGAGAWEEIPCIIVKGVCDYADSHKNKLWQDFAAATAACVAKALVERYPQTDKPLSKSMDKPLNDSTDKSGFGGTIERASPGGGLIYYEHISGGNVFTGVHSSGTQTFNFWN